MTPFFPRDKYSGPPRAGHIWEVLLEYSPFLELLDPRLTQSSSPGSCSQSYTSTRQPHSLQLEGCAAYRGMSHSATSYSHSLPLAAPLPDGAKGSIPLAKQPHSSVVLDFCDFSDSHLGRVRAGWRKNRPLALAKLTGNFICGQSLFFLWKSIPMELSLQNGEAVSEQSDTFT